LSASWQAVTRVNTEAAPKDTMRRPTLPGVGGRLVRIGHEWTTQPICFAGVVGGSMPARSDGQHGKPARVGDRLTLTATLGGWPVRVTEGLVVPTRPGNAGGGKGPWFQGADGAARDGGDWP
jgi:hypothetical protein